MNLFWSSFTRVITAITAPFRMGLLRIMRLFNINVITAKLVRPLNKAIRQIMKSKPTSSDDYISIGKFLVYKNIFMLVVLGSCAAIFIYFSMFASALPTVPPSPEAVLTNTSFDYNDMDLQEYVGVANILAADGARVYTGAVEEGIAAGDGTLYDREGKMLYTGMFDNNMYNGQGIAFHSNGVKKYEGTFVDNLYSGEGMLYSERGELIYEGTFANGQFSGTGRMYQPDYTLAYEGNFINNLFHGMGVLYYENGTVKYDGMFHGGLAQGNGTLYSENGSELYTGSMYAGNINYASLVNTNLSQIESWFFETPKVYYSDDDTAFVFEQAGVVLTTDTKVQVQTWENPETAGDSDSSYYYMPGGSDGSVVDNSGGWYTGTVDTGSNADSTDSTTPPAVDATPDFVTQDITLYYEIDKNVWRSEKDDSWEDDKQLITIDKVTAYRPNEYTAPANSADMYTDNTQIALDDCVAIDQIRITNPTAFSSVVFELDKYNKLFTRLVKMNFADLIVRNAYEDDGLLYKYSYYDNVGGNIAYFSVESLYN